MTRGARGRVGWVGLLLGLWPLIAPAQVARQEPVELAAAITGRVCRDLNGDGVCAPDEPGLADIRLVLASGREVRTDARGRYHFAQVDARSPDVTGGVHLRPGRQRLRVDPRTLPPGGHAVPEAVTLEIPWAAGVLRDFAVQTRHVPAPPVSLDYEASPPAARVLADGVDFLLAGRAAPRESVTVGGVDAEVDAQGGWRARVRLVPGQNVLALSVLGTDGAVRLFDQRVDVVARDGGWLVVPRAPEPRGALRLPGTLDEPPATGPSSVIAEFPVGTRVRSPQGEVTVGAEGSALLPLVLQPGVNPIHLEVQPPGAAAWWSVTVPRRAVPRNFAVGLLDVEATFAPATGLFRLRGRGSAHGEAHLGDFSLVGELDLKDTDWDVLRGRPLLDALRPEVPRLDRVPDPDLAIAEWGDTSVGLTPNPAESRLRLEVRHERWGRVGLGTYRAVREDGEVGRFHRPLFGPYAELATALGPVRTGVKAYAGGLSDPVRAIASRPAYEELRATGGSLYYLGSAPVAEGSELLRVEWRDGLTGLPLAERHLVRGVDYDIDSAAGRVLLAQPLSFLAGQALLRTEPLTSAPEPVLCVEYAVLSTGAFRDAVGGEAWAEWTGGRVSVAAMRRPSGIARYQLVSGHARQRLGAYTLIGEVARSAGLAVRPESFGVSDDGGLSFLRPEAREVLKGGDAIGLRLRGPGLFGQGSVDVALRRRTEGFSDTAHADTQDCLQASLRAVQPWGPWRLTLLGDERRSADPRWPFGDRPFESRTLGAGLDYTHGRWGAGVEVRGARLLAASAPDAEETLSGARASAGLHGHLRLDERWRVSLSHRQALARWGAGPGQVDDTFSAAGVDLTLREAVVGVRGGWGPTLGPLAWVQGQWKRGEDTYYGGYSVDVDGPNLGASRAVSGASTTLDGHTNVYVEDTASHDTQAVRLARAVGFQRTVFGAMKLGARYERGVRNVLGERDPLARDVAGVSGQLVFERLRASGHVEWRFDRGTPGRGSSAPVDRRQRVTMLALEALLREDLSLSGRLNHADTFEREAGRTEARLLEGFAALSWRPGPWVLVARYGLTRELQPGERAVFGERAQRIISLLPAVHLGGRFDLAAGVHVSRSNQGRVAIWVVTGSLRPSLRVVGGLEVAVEGAVRSVATDNESLGSLRGEVAYRVDERLRVATGYTLLGFTGTGLPQRTPHDSDRLYLRAELAY
ncbi:flagellar motor protein [Archangium primigenium]|uniref:flagellar motor protein n=1 Tax=[Archangium] primigenium TaxID=2792470 RepID=UPI0030846ACE